MCNAHDRLSRESRVCIVCVLDYKLKEAEDKLKAMEDERNTWSRRYERTNDAYVALEKRHEKLREHFGLPKEKKEGCEQS